MTRTFRFEVSTERRQVQAFAEALGLVGAGEAVTSVPLTYPVRWLAEEVVGDWLARALGADALPIHEMQDFAYRSSLAIGRVYALHVRCEPVAVDPVRLALVADALEGEALICTTRSTIRRIARTVPP